MFFVPLTKIDVAQRLVYGLMTAEAPDRSGEILDYATAKPAIQKWSDEISAATGGESLGNLRLMHGKVAIGKLVKIAFDDVARQVMVCAKVVDDAAWKLVDEHVLTGFSIGGGYAKRWVDPVNRALKRFTPMLTELSLVDLPCLPGATFDLIKADGATETVEWSTRFEPGNDEVKALAADMAKLAGKDDRANDYLVKARAELIHRHAEGVADELEKGATETVVVPPAEDDPAAALEKALAEAAAATTIETPEDAAAKAASEAALAKFTAEAAVVTPDGLKAVSEALDGALMVKGIWTLQTIGELLSCANNLRDCLASEAAYEGDNSPAPAAAAEIVRKIAALLVQQAKEETAELLADMAPDSTIAPALMALAAPVFDLVKADTETMEKVGRRNSNADQARIQGIHDHAMTLGASCDDGTGAEKMAKLAGLEDELARSRRVITAALPQIQSLTKAVADGKAAAEAQAATHAEQLAALRADLEKLAKGPGAPKGMLRTGLKGEDGTGQFRTIGHVATPEEAAAVFDWNSASPAERRERALANMQKRRQLPAIGRGY